MKAIEKVVKHAFGKDVYLLGIDKEGIAYWLEQPTWDCGWYWGCGYVETYTNNLQPDYSKDINSHEHFDSKFLGENMFDYWHEFFEESTLNDQEIWLLWDYMQSIYTLKRTAELFSRGHSHITEQSMCEAVKDTELCKRINEQMLPALFERVKQLLTNQNQ
jgi:hypothetical protein